jgi:hypothetical protein
MTAFFLKLRIVFPAPGVAKYVSKPERGRFDFVTSPPAGNRDRTRRCAFRYVWFQTYTTVLRLSENFLCSLVADFVCNAISEVERRRFPGCASRTTSKSMSAHERVLCSRPLTDNSSHAERHVHETTFHGSPRTTRSSIAVIVRATIVGPERLFACRARPRWLSAYSGDAQSESSEHRAALSIARWFYVKSNRWAYEREWRCLRSKPGPQSFPPEALTRIVVGCADTDATLKAVRQARRFGLEIVPAD